MPSVIMLSVVAPPGPKVFENLFNLTKKRVFHFDLLWDQFSPLPRYILGTSDLYYKDILTIVTDDRK